MYWELIFIAEENKSKFKFKVLNNSAASLAWWVPYIESLWEPTWGAGIKLPGWLTSLALLIRLNLPLIKLSLPSFNASSSVITERLWVLQETTWTNLSYPAIRAL